MRPVDRRDGLQVPRPAHRELHGVEPAPRDAGHADAAAAPVLRGQPREHVLQVLVLGRRVLVQQHARRGAGAAQVEPHAGEALGRDGRVGVRSSPWKSSSLRYGTGSTIAGDGPSPGAAGSQTAADRTVPSRVSAAGARGGGRDGHGPDATVRRVLLTPTERDRLLLFSAAELARPGAPADCGSTSPRRRRSSPTPSARRRAAARGTTRRSARAGPCWAPDDVLPEVPDVVRPVAGRGRVRRRLATRRSVTDAVRRPGPGADMPGAVRVAELGRREPADAVGVEVVNTAPVPDLGHHPLPLLRGQRAAARSTARPPTAGTSTVAAGASCASTPGERRRSRWCRSRGARVVVGFAGLVDGPLDAPGDPRDAPRQRARAGDAPRQRPSRRRRRSTREPRPMPPRCPVRGAPVTDAERTASRPARRRLGDAWCCGRLAGSSTTTAAAGRRGAARVRQDRPRRDRHEGARTGESCDAGQQRAAARPGARHRADQHRHPRGPRRRDRAAGNPDTMDDVDLVIGSGTAIVSGEGLIATPGAIDTHVHMLSPRVCEAELASGVTTSSARRSARSGASASARRGSCAGYAAFDDYPLNIGILAAARPAAGTRCWRRSRPACGLQGARGHRRPPAHPGHRAHHGRGVRRPGRRAHRRPQRGADRRGHAGGARRAAPSTRTTSRAAAAVTRRTC